MAQAIRFNKTGGPDDLYLSEIEVAQPNPWQVCLAHKAVGLNSADTYFRSGIYPVAFPGGVGGEAAGVVIAVGEGVVSVAVGDRITYTGFTNTLSACSTERIVPADALIQLAACIPIPGQTSAYLMRRIYGFETGQSILLHAAAGGVVLIVKLCVKLLGLTVIGTVSTEVKAEIAHAHGCDHVINYSREEVAPRVREVIGGRGVDVVFGSVCRATFMASLGYLKRRRLIVCVGELQEKFSHLTRKFWPAKVLSTSSPLPCLG